MRIGRLNICGKRTRIYFQAPILAFLADIWSALCFESSCFKRAGRWRKDYLPHKDDEKYNHGKDGEELFVEEE